MALSEEVCSEHEKAHSLFMACRILTEKGFIPYLLAWRELDQSGLEGDLGNIQH
jgi:hypothetical protein